MLTWFLVFPPRVVAAPERRLLLLLLTSSETKRPAGAFCSAENSIGRAVDGSVGWGWPHGRALGGRGGGRGGEPSRVVGVVGVVEVLRGRRQAERGRDRGKQDRARKISFFELE